MQIVMSLDEWQTYQQTKRKEVEDATAEVVRRGGEIDNLKDKIRDLEATVRKRNCDLEASDSSFKMCGKEVERLKAENDRQITAWKATCFEKEEVINNLRTSLEQANRDKTNYLVEKTKIEMELDAASKSLAQTHVRLDIANATIAKLRGWIVSLKSSLVPVINFWNSKHTGKKNAYKQVSDTIFDLPS